MIHKNRGFTLTELLIVVGITGILVSLSFVAYSTAQRNSRDSRRKTDLKAIQQGFEQYYGASNLYPQTCGSIGASYLPGGIPADPKGEDYSQYCNTTSYCFCALLESGVGANSTYDCSGNTTGKFYCVKQLQQ